MQDYKMLLSLLQTEAPSPLATACVGFDAAVDLLTRPIREIRQDGTREHFSSIGEFGRFLEEKQGLSCTVDVSTVIEKPGGNMVNLSYALAALGMQVECVGTLGQPEIATAFLNKPKGCTYHSVGDNGNCFALEFPDGKVMLAEMDRANELSFEVLTDKLGIPKMMELFGNCQLAGLVNWSEITGSTGIWQGLLSQVYEKLPVDKTRYILFDLTDCARHTPAKIQEALYLAGRFSGRRTTVLSMNTSEASQFAKTLGQAGENDPADIAEYLLNATGIDYVVIHTSSSALAIGKDCQLSCEGFYTSHPAISTGGGDNFNAGLGYALVNGMNLAQGLLMGNATAGYYVRNGASPSRKQLVNFLEAKLKEDGCQ